MPFLNLKKLIAVIIIIVCAATMMMLGFWQLDRMEQKQRRLDSIAQKQAEETLDITDAVKFTDPRDVRIRMTGTPDTDAVLLLDNQIVDGRPGYDVLVPVMTNVGWVLANFGWVAGSPYRDQLPEVVLPTAMQQFTGVLTKPTENPMVRETVATADTFPLVIQKIDSAHVSTLLKRSVLPYVVVLTEQSDAFIRRWEPVVMPPEKHLAYAVQWFALAGAALLIAFFAGVRRKSP
ncbi:SURF1 family protein [Alteromonas sp. CYL-A6]|uniref:SURF1 family protein n=1 Tax=Alteromonas nitratireducens TaxID=3390813 RepID=UPI0034ABE70D